MKTVISTDMEKVARLAGRFPGPVFDLRLHDDSQVARVRIGTRVLSVQQTGASSLRSIMAAAERLGRPVYVIGEKGEWQLLLDQAGMLPRASADGKTSNPGL